jgi:tripartite-type tricarboxylate transporter receptor subunit TctC
LIASKNPGLLDFGSTGLVDSPYLSGELLKKAAGIDIGHVPDRGSAPMLCGPLP